MAQLELSIPSTTTIHDTKPYTAYDILLRLPLRSFTVQKRYSDFHTLHSTLISLTGTPPPAPLPSKSWFTRTINNDLLLEQRRAGLERYLLAILTSSDPRWRETPAWRSFLNLPSSWVPSSNASNSIANTGLLVQGTPNDAVTDPTLWLDRHRELKGLLHDARNFIAAKEEAKTPSQVHEAGTGAKKCLIRAGGLINSLERGLKSIESDEGRGRLGEGELRRRRDLLTNARSERDTLETLSSATTKRFPPPTMPGAFAAAGAQKGGSSGRAGRVLGGPPQETERTRELDNGGVLGLQKTIMKEQDQDLEELLKMVRRQKDIGLAIGEEVEIQNVMLNSINEDVDRVEGKMRVAKKKLDKIS